MGNMSTLVFFHAHPDDEASQTAGTMILAAARGDRVVVVFATGGEHGTVPVDLGSEETIAQRRRHEAGESARVLGIARVAWLGYQDSGMTGWEQNGDASSFVQAEVDQAASRLAAILDEEDADVLIGYDWHGNYGHPDHIKVHAVTYRGAELARDRPRVLESTSNRDDIRRMAARAAALGLAAGADEMVGDDGRPIGMPESEIGWRVDVRGVLARKREALAAHASQSDTRWMLSLPEEAFAAWMGYEYYRENGRPGPMVDGWPFQTARSQPGHS